MTRLRIQYDSSFEGTVIAELLEIESPNDTVRLVRTVSRKLVNGFASLNLSPTTAGQAYKVYLAPKQRNILPRFIQLPDQSWIDIEDCPSVDSGSLMPNRGGSTPISWNEIKEKPSAFTPESHQHAMVDIGGLQESLNSKQSTGDYPERQEVESLVQNSLSSMVSIDEIQHNVYIDSRSGVSQGLPNFITTILYAPYRMRITRLTLIFDELNLPANSTDYVTFTLRRYDPGTSSGNSIVVKMTSSESIIPRKPYLFDALAWNESAAVLEPGQTLSLGWANSGVAKISLPVVVSVGVEPA